MKLLARGLQVPLHYLVQQVFILIFEQSK